MAWQGDQGKFAEWQQRLRRFKKSGLTIAGSVPVSGFPC